ncbi:MAG: hypothetical protein D6732_18645 [Methanobacteriota archaeon]|nr:MAG: hypothetical protein D6732_18645 [Euryarchaeota archaeon]
MVEIDIGYALLVVIASIGGSIIQFWVGVYKEEMELAGGVIDLLAKELKEMPEDLIKVGTQKRAKILRSYLKSKRKNLRSKYLDKWMITVFFGIIAGILYLLIGSLEPNAGYFIAAVVNGYAGESFVMKVLTQESGDVSWSRAEFEQFQREFMEKD